MAYGGERKTGSHALRRLNTRLRAGGHRIARDEGGNVAMMAGASFLGMALILGGAVDLYRYETQRKRVQAVVDNCVLLGTRIDNGAETIAEVEQLIADCADKQGVPVKASQVTVTSTQQEFDRGIRSVEIDHQQNMNTTFLRLASIPDMGINATAAAYEKEQYAEISIVLDLSGSMAGPVSDTDPRRRFDLMREEVANFVGVLLANGGDQVTSINLVPYSSGVNIGRGMFQQLGVKRTHNYTSCVNVEFSGSDRLRAVEDEVRNLEQTTPSMLGGPGWLHNYDFEQTRTDDGANNYYVWYDPRSAGTSTWIGPNKIHFPANDVSNEVDAEMWGCPDDPHAYMIKPYEPFDVDVRDDGSATVEVDDVVYPFYRDELTNHIVECPAIDWSIERRPGDRRAEFRTGKHCNWTADDVNARRDGSFGPTLTRAAAADVPYEWVSDETAHKAFGRGHLRIDGDDASIEYVSNDADRLRERLRNLPIGVSTGTDQGMAWAHMLLDPDMNAHIKEAAENGLINVHERMLDRPRKYRDDPSLDRTDPARKTRKFIVLLTDGQTTGYDESNSPTRPNYEYGYPNSQNNGNAGRQTVTRSGEARDRVQEVCEKATEAGVEVYTIAFALNNADAKRKLVQCAAGDTSARKHPNAYEAGSDLSTVFDTIAASIQRLRLTS